MRRSDVPVSVNIDHIERVFTVGFGTRILFPADSGFEDVTEFRSEVVALIAEARAKRNGHKTIVHHHGGPEQ